MQYSLFTIILSLNNIIDKVYTWKPLLAEYTTALLYQKKRYLFKERFLTLKKLEQQAKANSDNYVYTNVHLYIIGYLYLRS